MATKKRKSRILGEMHETALGLHGAGLISKRRMGEFEALCHLHVHEMPPRKIKTLRENAHEGSPSDHLRSRSTLHSSRFADFDNDFPPGAARF